MIQQESRLRVADNTGRIKEVRRNIARIQTLIAQKANTANN